MGEAFIASSFAQQLANDALPAVEKTEESAPDEGMLRDKVADDHVMEGSNADKNVAIIDDLAIGTALLQVDTVDERRVANSSDLLVYLHVWDALVPRARPESALYLTIRVYRQGRPSNRASTRPARNHNWPINDHSNLGSSTRRRRCLVTSTATKAGGPVHVIWDEHVALVIDGVSADCTPHGEDHDLVELWLSDATANLDATSRATTVLASRAAEPLSSFADQVSCRQHSYPYDIHASSSRSPDVFVYTLKVSLPDRTKIVASLEEGGRGPAPGRQHSESNIADGGQEVKVRLASLVISRSEALSRADEVHTFLQNKANIPRIQAGPNGFRTEFLTSGVQYGLDPPPDVSNLFVSDVVQGSRLGKDVQVLDLSAACDIFRRFAGRVDDRDGEANGNHLVSTKPDETNMAGDATTRDERSAGCHLSESLPTEKLAALAREFFPRVLHAHVMADYDSVDSKHSYRYSADSQNDKIRRGVTGRPDLCVDLGNHWSPRHCHEPDSPHPSLLSLADFFSWLRILPEEALASAGLLVSSQVALEKTGTVMSQFQEKAQALSDTLEASLKSSTEEVFVLSLESTRENVSIDRLCIGRGEQNDNTAERTWDRHVRNLRRDVKVILQALTVLESEMCPQEDSKVSTRDARKSSSVGVSDGVAIEGTLEEDLDVERMRKRDGNTEHVIVESASDPRRLLTSEHAGTVDHAVMALHVGQEAAKLALAADHLKEVFRRVGDKMLRRKASKCTSERGSCRYKLPRRTSAPTLSPTSDDWASPTEEFDGQANTPMTRKGAHIEHRRSGYDTLVQYINAVQGSQAQITAVRRRAARLVNKTKQDKREGLIIGWRDVDGKRRNERRGFRSDVDEAVRRQSASALVRRIREAQAAIQPPQAKCLDLRGSGKKHDAFETPQRSAVEENHQSLFFVSPESSCNYISGSPIVGNAVGPMYDRANDGNSPRHALLRAVDNPDRTEREEVEDLGGVFPEHESGGVPWHGRFRPSCLRRINERLDELRSEFDRADGVSLPVPVAKATAELIVRLGNGTGWPAEGGEVIRIRSPPAAAICCPIDRYIIENSRRF